jgi:hypothetical protein
MAIATFNPSKDCTINLALPTTADNTTSLEMSRNTAGTAKKRALMEFDLSSLVGAVESVVSAELTLNNTGGAYGGVATFNFYRLTVDDWTEAATWETADGASAWSSQGGDYTLTLGMTSTPGGGSPADLTLSNSHGLDDLVVDAIDDRSGILSLIGMLEAVGADNSWIGDSSEAASVNNRPTLVITYLPCPVIERIARKFATRLESVVTGGTYHNTFTVVRPLPAGTQDWSHGKVIVEQAPEAERIQLLSGNPPAIDWRQDIIVTVCVGPSESSTTPLDTAMNFAAADAETAITTDADGDWAQWDALAIDTKQTGRDIENDGTFKLIKLTYSVTYRTSETNPYTVLR